MGSVGKVIPGVRVAIDTALSNVPGQGEIVVYGPNVMQGYHNRKEENDAVLMTDGAFKTGDMGRIDEEGFLFITGRIKEQYKLENGKYVVPTPLEETYKLSPYVLNAMVYGDNKPYNVALIVADVRALEKWGAENGVSEKDPEKLLANPKVQKLFKTELDHYGEKFKGFEGVKDFALIAEDFTTENGMLTPSLKVKRKKVFETYQGQIEALYTKKKEKPEGAAPEKKKAEATAE